MYVLFTHSFGSFEFCVSCSSYRFYSVPLMWVWILLDQLSLVLYEFAFDDDGGGLVFCCIRYLSMELELIESDIQRFK